MLSITLEENNKYRKGDVSFYGQVSLKHLLRRDIMITLILGRYGIPMSQLFWNVTFLGPVSCQLSLGMITHQYCFISTVAYYTIGPERMTKKFLIFPIFLLSYRTRRKFQNYLNRLSLMLRG